MVNQGSFSKPHKLMVIVSRVADSSLFDDEVGSLYLAHGAVLLNGVEGLVLIRAEWR